MGKRKVLVVEDEVTVLEYLGSYIPLLGYEVETAKDGMEALAKVNAFKPDLLVLDLHLPKLDGMSVLKEVYRHQPKMKVLVVTGTQILRQDILKAGADEVVYKPIDLTVLSEEINKLLPPVKEPAAEEVEYARLEIVEDEEGISDFLKADLFEPIGIEVYTATNVPEALKVYQTKRPQIVIVDLGIPNKEDGYDLVQKLSTNTDPPPPKSIIIQTAALGDTTERLKRQGYPVFDKPLDYERLRERVLEACKKYGLRLKTGSGKSQEAS